MLLTRYGRREWLTTTIIAAILLAIFASLAWWWPLALTGLVWLAVVAFFRDPPRHVPEDIDPGAMLAPADGLVRSITRLDHHEATGGPALSIRIFLSVLDVHVNRSPIDGEVVSVSYRPGKFLDARTEESVKVNESNLVVMRIETGETIGVRQVSGAIARRIVCEAAAGDHLKRGQRFGMIKFGSTTELILPRPDDVHVHVEAGAKVKGGRTILAMLEFRGQ